MKKEKSYMSDENMSNNKEWLSRFLFNKLKKKQKTETIIKTLLERK